MGWFSKWRSARHTRRIVEGEEYRAEFRRRLNARYDAAQTTTENENHWANADGLGPNAATSAAVRQKVRRRARYEVGENNSYAKGMVLGFGNELIGTGPRLQLATKDKQANTRVERSFFRWAEEIGLAERLRTLSMAYVTDGEAFALLTTNEKLMHAVKLDVVPLECDYFEPTVLRDGTWTDGAEYDRNNNPVRWFKWPEHPGEAVHWTQEPVAVDASQVLHVHRPDRPGQRRGISHMVTALPLFAMYRRFKLATLAAAETAAHFSAVLYTNLNVEAAVPGGSKHWGRTVPIEHRAMMTLPEGWEMKQFAPEHPQTTLEMFENRIISEVARCLLQPLNVAIGSSKDHNFSSGQLDGLGWKKAITVERSRWVCRMVHRIVRAWLDEAVLIRGLLPMVDVPMAEWDYGYRWDAAGIVDEAKQAKADHDKLADGTTTRTAIYARDGRDIDIEDEVAAAENGVTVEEYKRGIWQTRTGGGHANSSPANEETDEAEETPARAVAA